MLSNRFLGAHIFALLVGLLGFIACAAASPLTVIDPWVREGPPTATVLAGYMIIENPSGQVRSVVQVDSPDFERVEIHRTEIDKGVARMVEQDALEIPARGQVILKPGGYHLMLMGATKPFRVGDSVDMVLRLENGDEVSVKAVVKAAEGEGMT